MAIYKVKVNKFNRNHPDFGSGQSISTGIKNQFEKATCDQKFSDEIHAWLFENINNKYHFDGGYIIFSNESDAVYFKIVWSGIIN